MKATRLRLTAATTFLFAGIATCGAHELPWRAGEARRIPFGSCAKGPCMYLADWSPTRPHCHVKGAVLRERKDCERAGHSWPSVRHETLHDRSDRR